MSKKLVIATCLLAILTLTSATCLLARPSTSPAKTRATKTLRFRVVKHRRHSDVVKRGHLRLLVRRHRALVKLAGVPRYRVLARHSRYVVLSRLSTSPLPGTPVSVEEVSTASSSKSGSTAALANDGRSATSWVARSATYPQWWTVDLGAARALEGVKSAWNGRSAYRYTVETSLDGVTYATVANRKDNASKGATTDRFTEVARYVRIRVLGVSSRGTPASVNEFTVQGAATPVTDPTPTPTATPTVTPTPTVKPTVTPTVTPTPTVKPTVTPTASAYNVKDYGASGNGTTDDRAAIQNAINACSTAGGGIVYLPAGTYRLTSYTSITGQPGVPALPEASFSLQLRNGVTVQGASRASTVIVGDYSASGMHPLGGDHNSNIGVKSLTIRCTKSATDGVKFLQCDNVTIDDVLADGQGVMYIGLALYSCHDSVIENSTAQNCYGFGFCSGEADVLGYTWATDNVLIANCNATGCGTNFRTRGTMTSVGSPYTLRKDAPVRNLRTTFSNCTSTKAVNYGFQATNAGSETFTHCSHDGSGSQTYYHYAMQGVINAEMIECTDGGTLVNATNSAVSPWHSWWTSDGGYGACSSDYITANGARTKASGT